MKNLILILLLFSSSSVFAAAKPKAKPNAQKTVKQTPSKTMAEISFTKAKKTHQFSLLMSKGKKPQYRLQFSDTPHKFKTKPISFEEARAIQKDITYVIWKNEYRKPASSTGPCREFARFKTSRERTTVCEQDRAMSVRSYALLTSLRQKFQ